MKQVLLKGKYMKKNNPRTAENIEKLEKVIEEKKKIPKSVKEKISGKVFENVIIGAFILIYFGTLNLGNSNIPKDNYLMDLKVLSIILLGATITMFEIAYRKDETSLWGHGVEVLAVAIFTLYLVSLHSKYYSSFSEMILSVAMFVLIYYIVKILILKRRIKKNYGKSLVDIGEIVKK